MAYTHYGYEPQSPANEPDTDSEPHDIRQAFEDYTENPTPELAEWIGKQLNNSAKVISELKAYCEVNEDRAYIKNKLKDIKL